MRPRSPEPPRYLVAHPGAELYGSDRVMLESVAAMSAAGAAVIVTLPESGPLVDALGDIGATVRIDPALVLRKSLLRPRNWAHSAATAVRAITASRRILREVRPDVVYVSTMTLPLWTAAARIARIPTLLHLHEGEQNASRVVKRAIYAPALLAQSIIVNSEFSRGVLAQAYPRLARRAEVVYNGVAGPAKPTPARQRLEGGIRLVYIGRLSPRKGPDLIVEALTLLEADDIEVALVGAVFRGYEWYERELRAGIETAGLADRVTLIGFRDDVWRSLDAADVVVVPSRLDEPFGNTAVEGTLAERVVLVSDTSGLREATAGVDTAIRFAPDDASALAEAIIRARDSWSDLRPQLAAEAVAAAERFSPSRYRDAISERMAQIRRG